MILESWLAYAHILAFLGLTVFLTSETALCRSEWLNGQVLERLVLIDLIYGICAVSVVLTGAARIAWGIKGWQWYLGNPLLHLKITLFVVMALLSIGPSLAFRRWRRQWRSSGTLPEPLQVRHIRRLVMWQAHLLPFVPLAAVFLARGYGR